MMTAIYARMDSPPTHERRLQFGDNTLTFRNATKAPLAGNPTTLIGQSLRPLGDGSAVTDRIAQRISRGIARTHPAVAHHRCVAEGARSEGRRHATSSAWARASPISTRPTTSRKPPSPPSAAARRNTPPSKAFPNCARRSPRSSSARTVSTTSPSQCFVSPGGKNVHLQRADGDAEPGRRGDHARRPTG